MATENRRKINQSGKKGESLVAEIETGDETQTKAQSQNGAGAKAKGAGVNSQAEETAIPEEEGREEEQPTITVEETAQTRQIPKTTRYRQKKKAEQEAQETVLVLTSIMDGLVTMAFGDYAKMTKQEQELIAEPLQRIIMRSGFNATETIQKWGDPLMLLMGLVAWGSRIYRVESEKAQAKQAQQMPVPQEKEREIEKEEKGAINEYFTQPLDIGEALQAPAGLWNQINEV